MNKRTRELLNLLKNNRDGAFSTQANRGRRLKQIFRTLDQLGYEISSVYNFKPKHIDALVIYWNAQNLNIGTIKNRLTDLRWLARKINRISIIPKSNKQLGIPNRTYKPKTSKATNIDEITLSSISNLRLQASLRLQKEFGLRRESALKIKPKEADQGEFLHLQPSWTKGGKEHRIPIRTASQREALEFSIQIAGNSSLIPPKKSYKEHVKTYEHLCQKRGLHKLHGLRHRYAQRRFRELAGFPCPLEGGPTRQQMTPEQRQLDHDARQTISRAMGHERIQIMTIYLGS